jgi:dTDP-glucose 4,6-dehydratase
VRDWLHVADHAAGILAAASLGTPGRSYNLGGTSAVNIDVIRRICAVLDEVEPEGAPHARWITSVADRPGHDRRYAIDGGRAALDLGWRPIVAWDDGIRRVIERTGE